MLKLISEMPSFLKYNEVLISKKIYLEKKEKSSVGTYRSPAYLSTTENINGYYDLMNFKDKKILTVIGASDQIFNAILRGAKIVDGFDISIYAIMFYYLKEAALKALNYEEFIDFLYGKENIFSKKTYAKIIPYLNELALPFWNLVFKTKSPKKIIESSWFSFNSVMNVKHLTKVSSFLDKANFYKVKEQIKKTKIRIFLEDVKSLDNIDGMYDYIILSNIIDYQKESLYLFEQAIERYVSKLNVLGEIKVGYCYYRPSGYEGMYDIEEITSYSGAITGEKIHSNYILTKKRTN